MLQRHLATRPRAFVQLSLLLLVQNPLLPRPEIRAHEPQPISRVSRRLQQPISRERASKPNEPIMLQHLQLRLRAFPQRRVPALPSRIDRVSKPSLAVSRLVDFAHARVRVSLLRRHERHDVSRFQSRPSRAAARVIHLSPRNLQRLARPRFRRRPPASLGRARRRRSSTPRAPASPARARSASPSRRRARARHRHRLAVAVAVVVARVVARGVARATSPRRPSAARASTSTVDATRARRAREHRFDATARPRAMAPNAIARIERSRAQIVSIKRERDRRKDWESADEDRGPRRDSDETRRGETDDETRRKSRREERDARAMAMVTRRDVDARESATDARRRARRGSRHGFVERVVRARTVFVE